jgi:excisionase family DNA binding protein
VNVDLLIDELADRVADRVADRLAADSARAQDGPVEPWHLLDVDTVARMLGRSRRWVHGATKEKRLPHVRLDGRKLMFDPEDVRAWCRERRVGA